MKSGHDEEVARETHGLHHVELEVHVLIHILGQRIAIKLPGSLVGEVAQVFCLKLDAVYLVVAAQIGRLPSDLPRATAGSLRSHQW